MTFFSLIKNLAGKIRLWRQVAEQRRELRGLSDDMLKDIGLSRADATREADRYFWDHALLEDSSLRRYQRPKSGGKKKKIKCRGKYCLEI